MLGSGAIAALSVAFPVQMMLGGIAIGSGVGAASFVSRRLGAGKYQEAYNGASQAMALALILGILVIIAGVFSLGGLLEVFGVTPEIYDDTYDYLSIIMLGAPTIFLMMISISIIRGEGNAMVAMKAMVGGAILNIFLDPVFIFTLGLGIRGAAWATVVSRSLSVIYVIFYFCSGHSSLKFSLPWFIPRWHTIVEIYKVGIPASLVQIAFHLALIFVNRILGTYDYVALAAMGIIVRLQLAILLPCVGISQGLLTIIGFNYGAAQFPRVREALLKGTLAGFLFALFVTAMLFIFPIFFISIFNREPALLELGSFALRIMVVTFPMAAVQIMSSAFFQAVGRGFPALILSVSRQFLFFVPVVLLLNRHFGMTGIWFAAPVADILALILAGAMIAAEFKRMNMNLLRKQA